METPRSTRAVEIAISGPSGRPRPRSVAGRGEVTGLVALERSGLLPPAMEHQLLRRFEVELGRATRDLRRERVERLLAELAQALEPALHEHPMVRRRHPGQV